jgi:DNA-directed RNA polymerase sigma subunit (sigma70/sigma32)
MDTNKRINAAQQAVNQEARRRRAEALAMQTAGKSLKEIGDHFQVSRERARQMVARAIQDAQGAGQ